MSSELLQDETLAHKFIRRGFWGYFFMLFIAPTGYIVRLLVTNTISIEEVGVLYSIIGFVGLLSTYNDLGLTEALQYFVPKYRLEKKYDNLSTIFWLTMIAQIISSIVVGGAMRYASDRLALHYFQTPIASQIIQIYAFYFLFINISQSLGSLLQAFQDTFTGQLLEFCRNLILIIAIGSLRGSDLLTTGTFSLSQLGAQAGVTILSRIAIRISYGYVIKAGTFKRDKNLIYKQFSYAAWIFLGLNIIVLFGQVDLQMILRFLGPAQAGIYTTYQSLYSLPIILIGPIYNLIFSSTTELHTKQHTEKIGNYLRFMCQYLLLFGMVLGGLFASCGPIIAQILFGGAFMDSGRLLALSSMFVPISILLGYINLVVGGIGGAKYRGVIFGIALVVNIVANILLIPIRGTYGAVIATGGARITMAILLLRYVYQRHPFGIDRFLITKNAILVIILSYLIYYIHTTYHIFTISGSHRASNLRIMSLISLVYLIIISLFNYSIILELWRQVRMSMKTQ